MNKETRKIKNVLIVDDEAVVRNGIGRILENKEIVSVPASNAHEALDLLSCRSFDLVLLDIRMPDMDGLEALKRIHSLYPELDVIMITGYPTIDTAVQCIKLGALDYLVKPFRLDDLEASLKKIELRNRESIKEVGFEGNGLQIDSFKTLIIGERKKKQIHEDCF